MKKDELAGLIAEHGLSIPMSDDLSVLSRPWTLAREGVTMKNSLTVHPIEVFRNGEDGSPNEHTYRQYERFALGGSSLIWFEAISVSEDGRSTPYQLWINEKNADSFARLVDMIHEKSGGVPVIAQLTHSGRFSKPHGKPEPVILYHNPVMNKSFDIPADYSVVTDDYIDRLEEKYYSAARLLVKAGFDGLDVKVCHRYFLSEMLSGYLREGKYGGSYENRTRFIRSVIRNIRAEFRSSKIVGSRLGLYDGFPYPYGYGVSPDDHIEPDMTEPLRFLGDIVSDGISVINFTMGTPYVNPHVNRPYRSGGYLPPEHPLAGVDRLIKYAGICKKAFPSLAVIGTGYSYLGEASQYAAAGAVEQGLATAVGFGRMAVAYPDFARDMLGGGLDARKVCLTCGKCVQIARAGGPTGCPIRDAEAFMPYYKKLVLKEE